MIWKLNLEPLWKHLRCCSLCGMSSCSIDLLCESCWTRLEPFRVPSNYRITGYPFPVSSLYLWPSGENLVTHLIHTLKGGGVPSAYQRIAEIFSISIMERSVTEEPLIFVPAPGKVPNCSDHAMMWAKALTLFWGGSCRPCLKRPQGWEQKSAKIRERRSLGFEKTKTLSNRNSRIIFVDDVITSGATAQAAHIALGAPKKFEVWTIAFRPKEIPL